MAIEFKEPRGPILTISVDLRLPPDTSGDNLTLLTRKVKEDIKKRGEEFYPGYNFLEIAYSWKDGHKFIKAGSLTDNELIEAISNHEDTMRSWGPFRQIQIEKAMSLTEDQRNDFVTAYVDPVTGKTGAYLNQTHFYI